MFKLNIINNNNNIFAYIVESSCLWHNHLGHVNFQRMNDMVKLDLIPLVDSNFEKCKACMLTKITRNPFPKIQRNSVLLKLVHSDVCDMHNTPTIGGKK